MKLRMSGLGDTIRNCCLGNPSIINDDVPGTLAPASRTRFPRASAVAHRPLRACLWFARPRLRFATPKAESAR